MLKLLAQSPGHARKKICPRLKIGDRTDACHVDHIDEKLTVAKATAAGR